MNTPIAFMIFNRADTTARVFERIRQARPPQLYVVGDGPRTNRTGEADQVAAARAVIDRVDWPCQVFTDFSETNLGCRRRISTGLNWVFANTDRAIILEDDCLPDPSFFPYCEQLLERYKEDERVFSIRGDFYDPAGTRPGSESYYFSKYPTCWGWATWRRGWAHYDDQMSEWPAYRNSASFRAWCGERDERAYWTKIFDKTHARELNSWAYAWVYASAIHGGHHATPSKNMISNIGFGQAATHTVQDSPFAALPTYPVQIIEHPKQVATNADADRREFVWTHLNITPSSWTRSSLGTDIARCSQRLGNAKRRLTHMAGAVLRRTKDLRRGCVNQLKRLFGKAPIQFLGPIESWEKAEKLTEGYTANVIHERVRASTLAVRDGVAVAERDGVTFATNQWNWPILASFARILATHPEPLRVLDFGGALGSTYNEIRSFLGPTPKLEWCVIEQPRLVKVGKAEFETDELRFYEDIDTCLREGEIDVVFISGVIQYLSQPYEMLETLLALRASTLIMDRTAIAPASEDILTIQCVPDWVYGAPVRYPAWFFSAEKLETTIRKYYDHGITFEGRDGIVAVNGRSATFTGSVWTRRDPVAIKEETQWERCGKRVCQRERVAEPLC